MEFGGLRVLITDPVLGDRGVWDQFGLFFGVKMAFFDVSAHTLHSLGQVTVTVKRILVQGLGSRV